jgi:hypothetical protein
MTVHLTQHFFVPVEVGAPRRRVPHGWAPSGEADPYLPLVHLKLNITQLLATPALTPGIAAACPAAALSVDLLQQRATGIFRLPFACSSLSAGA